MIDCRCCLFSDSLSSSNFEICPLHFSSIVLWIFHDDLAVVLMFCFNLNRWSRRRPVFPFSFCLFTSLIFKPLVQKKTCFSIFITSTTFSEFYHLNRWLNRCQRHSSRPQNAANQCYACRLEPQPQFGRCTNSCANMLWYIAGLWTLFRTRSVFLYSSPNKLQGERAFWSSRCSALFVGIANQFLKDAFFG